MRNPPPSEARAARRSRRRRVRPGTHNREGSRRLTLTFNSISWSCPPKANHPAQRFKNTRRQSQTVDRRLIEDSSVMSFAKIRAPMQLRARLENQARSEVEETLGNRAVSYKSTSPARQCNSRLTSSISAHMLSIVEKGQS